MINTNLTNNELINDIQNNELNLSTNIVETIKLHLPVGIVSTLKRKKACEIHVSGLACLWDSGVSNSMTKSHSCVNLKINLRLMYKSTILLEMNPLLYSYPVLLRRWISFGCRVRMNLV